MGKIIIYSVAILTYSMGILASGYSEVHPKTLTCDIVEHEKLTSMSYVESLGEMHFYEGSRLVEDHWDAFHFYKSLSSNRIFIVYHGATLTDQTDAEAVALSDAYIEPDNTGKILTGIALGLSLKNCQIAY